MKEVALSTEINETKKIKDENYRKIKPEGNISPNESRDFIKGLFETPKLEKVYSDYINDLKSRSEYPETISDSSFKPSDLRKITPEKNAEMREEFAEKKEQIKREWEQKNEIKWPTYKHDVYSSNGNCIRKVGWDYDMHHIQPLSLGGKNEVSNITPIHANEHYDHCGVHSADSPYSKMSEMTGGTKE